MHLGCCVPAHLGPTAAGLLPTPPAPTRPIAGELHGPLDVVNAEVAEAPADGAMSALVGWALGPRELQGTGFRVEYAVVVPASNVVDTGA